MSVCNLVYDGPTECSVLRGRVSYRDLVLFGILIIIPGGWPWKLLRSPAIYLVVLIPESMKHESIFIFVRGGWLGMPLASKGLVI